MKIEQYLKVIQTDEHPHLDIQDSTAIYAYKQFIYYRCPCGCGDLQILEVNRPNTWTFDDETITVSPSIYRNPGKKSPNTCESHYFIRNGKVVWA